MDSHLSEEEEKDFNNFLSAINESCVAEIEKIMKEIIIENRTLTDAIRHSNDRMAHLSDRVRDMRDGVPVRTEFTYKSEACSDSNR